jgi:bifunctional ADP-heptose synthase (sugar kinase/adenylyltransferase)
VHELNRIDIKNRTPLPAAQQELVVDRLCDLVPQVDGIIVADQVQERNCGTITDRIQSELAALAQRYPDKPLAADSRVRIGEFRHLIIKPNAREATLAVHPAHDPQAIHRDIARTSAQELYQKNERPVFLTVGADGILVFDDQGQTHVPGVQVQGPIDIVGAGDSTMAGIVSALCCGATHAQAALVGNLVASITIQQLGTTGTATPSQVIERYHQVIDRPRRSAP